MSRIKLIFCGLTLFAIMGCSLMEPYVDRRRDAGQPLDRLFVGKSQLDAPVICFNPLYSEVDEVQKMADEECVRNEKGNRAESVNKESFACTLLTPSYMYFKCVN